ncbi:MAG: hypothetical protein JXA50_01580 [Deltaproteobacteria bacterium]|nr:hypothetical protein [Deltaproteobacteria bacterium]
MGEKIGAREVIERRILGDTYTSKRALLQACQARRIPHIHINKRKVIFDVDDLNNFIESRKVEARKRV